MDTHKIVAHTNVIKIQVGNIQRAFKKQLTVALTNNVYLGKSTPALEDKSCSGGGARQSRRLKAKKAFEASEGESDEPLAKKSCAVLPTKPTKKSQ